MVYKSSLHDMYRGYYWIENYDNVHVFRILCSSKMNLDSGMVVTKWLGNCWIDLSRVELKEYNMQVCLKYTMILAESSQ